MFTARHVTPDGHEQTLALNHLAPFLLTDLLRERLAADGGGRVVTTASDAAGAGELDFDDLEFERRPFKPMRVYGTTQVDATSSSRASWPSAPPATAITATCFHPGVVRTGFGKNDGLLYRAALTVAGPFLRSPEKGARSLVWLALDPAAARADRRLRRRPEGPRRPRPPAATTCSPKGSGSARWRSPPHNAARTSPADRPALSG